MTDACDAVISEVSAKRREELENYETVTLRAASRSPMKASVASFNLRVAFPLIRAPSSDISSAL